MTLMLPLGEMKVFKRRLVVNHVYSCKTQLGHSFVISRAAMVNSFH